MKPSEARGNNWMIIIIKTPTSENIEMSNIYGQKSYCTNNTK